MAANVFPTAANVPRALRARGLGGSAQFRGCTVWFTGLPGAGKTSVAQCVERVLTQQGIACYCLDGDNIRSGLNRDLGFSPEGRAENIRRVAEVARLFADAGLVVLVSFISPYVIDRATARRIHDAADLPFVECFIDTPVDVCEARDPKGLYRRARAGQLRGFTGVDAPYEPPLSADLRVTTVGETEEQTAVRVLRVLLDRVRGRSERALLRLTRSTQRRA